MPELNEILPELRETTRVRTRRGYHYYFSLNGEHVKSTNRLFNKRLELKSNGTYVVAPPSTINDHQYTYEIPLSEIQPIPKTLIGNYHCPDCPKDKKPFKMPKYHGHKVDCIRQILSRDLQEGERNNSLFVLYNLLIQNRNTKEYSKKIIMDKNYSLSNPLIAVKLNKVYRKNYNVGCINIREKLSYIECNHCAHRFKDGRLKANNVLIKNIRTLTELSNTQRGIACLLGTVFEGENPSINKIAEVANMDWRIVSNTIKSLDKKGFFG